MRASAIGRGGALGKALPVIMACALALLVAFACAPARAFAAAPEAGVYTVSANLWVDAADAGLPMSPHLTNAGFPPKDPVSGNAVLEVDEAGNGKVTVPIVVQPEIMVLESVEGAGVVDVRREGDGIVALTIDLGAVDADKPVVQLPCTVGVVLGSRASQMMGASGEQSWPATFAADITEAEVVVQGDAAERARAAALAADDARAAAQQQASSIPPFAPIVIAVVVAAVVALVVALAIRRRNRTRA